MEDGLCIYRLDPLLKNILGPGLFMDPSFTKKYLGLVLDLTNQSDLIIQVCKMPCKSLTFMYHGHQSMLVQMGLLTIDIGKLEGAS